MADIFLSYTEKDREAVRRLADTLQSVGWSVWWDRRIPAGLTWRSVLDEELRTMRCMVVLWSSNSVQSEWVCEEAAEGRRLGRLVPVAIDRVRPPAGFREVQAADLVGWDGSRDFVGLLRLIEDLERLIGKPGAPASEGLQPAPAHEAGDGAAASVQPGRADRADRGPPADAPPAGTLPTRSKLRMLAPWVGAALLVAVAVGAFLAPWRTRPIEVPLGADSSSPAAAMVYPPASTSRPTAAGEPAMPPALAATGPVSTASSPPVRLPSATAIAPPKRPLTKGTSASASVSTRCEALLERLQLGEQLSSESQSFLNQECRQ